MTDERFEAAADELYSLTPERFTGRRDELVAEARAAGDRELAGRLAKLRKPTVAAWLVNLLARAEPEQIAQLRELGAELRRAHLQLSGPALRELSRQRGQLTRSLAQRAAALARADGHRVREDAVAAVTRTLEAALAEPQVAATVAAGRLTSAESYSGFGPSGLSAVPELTVVPRGGADSRDEDGGRAEDEQRRGAARSAAEQALAAAQRKADRAAESARDAGEKSTVAAAALAEIEQRIEALHGQLAAAEEEHRFAERAAAVARSGKQDADAALRIALERVRAAQSELDDV